MLNECYIGDCREGLRAFVAAGLKAQVCVTSPPYWGLRDYGIEPSVWGGLPDCEHVWGDEISIQKGGPTGNTSSLTNRGANQARTAVKVIQAGQFCRCGAWLGTLGLEPHYRMYIDHMVEVMDLVRQVLADDGTLWLNLGDSYANDGKWGGETGGKQAYLGEVNRKRVGRQKRKTGLKPKDMCLIPARVAIALQEAGWWVRQDIIWHKPNPMPESVTDRCTKTHEYLFLLSKRQRYYYDNEAIKERAIYGQPNSPESIKSPYGQGYTRRASQRPVAGWDTGPGNHRTMNHAKPRDPGNKTHKFASEYEAGDERHRTAGGLCDVGPIARANKRSVWTIPTEPYPEAHFATFPRRLIEPCILAGSRPGDIVLDPFMGSGTTAAVAEQLGRKWLGCEINPEYAALQDNRLRQQHLELETDCQGQRNE